MEAYLINPIARKPRRVKKETKTMAKRKKSGSRKKRKLAGAALAAYRKKRGLGSRKRKRSASKAAPRKTRRKRHLVAAHSRRGGAVSGYSRKGARVKKHWSNPFGLPSFGGMTRDIQDGILAAATLGAAFWGSRWLGNLAVRYIPGTNSGLPRWLTKLAVATGTVMVARRITRDPGLRKVALAAAYFPIAVEGLGMVAPGIASEMAFAPMLPAPSSAPKPSGMSAYLGMPPGPRLSDYTLDAELEAQLEQDMEYGVF